MPRSIALLFAADKWHQSRTGQTRTEAIRSGSRRPFVVRDDILDGIASSFCLQRIANCQGFPACSIGGMLFAASFSVLLNGGALAVAEDARLEFNEAVRECLANCYRTDLPVAALAEYVDILRQRDWTPKEIHKVEAAVLKILLAVVSKDERNDLVNRIIRPRDGQAAERQDTKGETARPTANRAQGNVLPPPHFFGAGDGAGKRS